jgi:hypothetical protein
MLANNPYSWVDESEGDDDIFITSNKGKGVTLSEGK